MFLPVSLSKANLPVGCHPSDTASVGYLSQVVNWCKQEPWKTLFLPNCVQWPQQDLEKITHETSQTAAENCLRRVTSPWRLGGSEATGHSCHLFLQSPLKTVMLLALMKAQLLWEKMVIHEN